MTACMLNRKNIHTGRRFHFHKIHTKQPRWAFITCDEYYPNTSYSDHFCHWNMTASQLFLKWSHKAVQEQGWPEGCWQDVAEMLSQPQWSRMRWKSRKEQYFTWQITLMLLVGFKEKEQIVWTDRSKQSTGHTSLCLQRHTHTLLTHFPSHTHGTQCSRSLTNTHTHAFKTG